jgi:hypothetical protein
VKLVTFFTRIPQLEGFASSPPIALLRACFKNSFSGIVLVLVLVVVLGLPAIFENEDEDD